MGSRIKSALKSGASSIAFAGGLTVLAGVVGGLGGCAQWGTVHTPDMARTMPDVDDRAAAILVSNAMHGERSGIKLVASDVFGQELHTRYVAYVQRNSKALIAEVPVE
jgi:hypothetical protein